MEIYVKVPVGSEIIESIVVGPIDQKLLADIPSQLLRTKEDLPSNNLESPFVNVVPMNEDPISRWDAKVAISNSKYDFLSEVRAVSLVLKHPLAMEVTPAVRKFARGRPIVVKTGSIRSRRVRANVIERKGGLALVRWSGQPNSRKKDDPEAKAAKAKSAAALQDGRGKTLIQLYEVKGLLFGLEHVTREWLNRCGFDGVCVKYYVASKLRGVEDLVKLVKAYERDKAPWARMLKERAKGQYGSSLAKSAITCAKAAVERHRRGKFKPKSAVEKRIVKILAAIVRR